MKKRTKWILCGIAVILWGTGIFGVLRSLLNESYVSIRNVGVTKAELEQALKQETEEIHFSVTLWDQQKEVSILDGNAGKKADVSVVSVCGDMAAVFPLTYRFGHPVLPVDEGGCVIDEETAYALFGAVDVIGNQLIWNRTEYEVKGVVTGYDGILMIQEQKENQSYSNMEFLFDQKSKGAFPELKSTKVANFMQRHFMQSGNKIDGEFGWQIVATLHFFPVLLFTFVICYAETKKCLGIENTWICRGMAAVLALGCILLLGKTCGYRLWLPNEWIPSKWSDFKFYTNQWKEVKEGLDAIKESELTAKDIRLEQGLYRGCFYGVIMLACSVGAWIQYKGVKHK